MAAEDWTTSGLDAIARRRDLTLPHGPSGVRFRPADLPGGSGSA